jgi:hypothetical protein
VIAGVEYQVAADAPGADAAIAPARPTVTPPAARILAHDRAVSACLGDLNIFTVPLVPVRTWRSLTWQSHGDGGKYGEFGRHQRGAGRPGTI